MRHFHAQKPCHPSASLIKIRAMPVATPAQYRAMLDSAQRGGYAYPAINVTSITTINGALRAFAEAKSDGIIQVSTGGGKFASGTSVGAVGVAGGEAHAARVGPGVAGVAGVAGISQQYCRASEHARS
jgi:hypothetical protein